MRETTTMKMPALAVVGIDHRIIRSTESFRRRYEDAEALCRQSPEIDLVLTGRADVATVNVGNLNVEIEAVTDAAGRRQAMLTLPPDGPSPEPEPPINALRDAADQSPAIVWVKDLEGRYLYANDRYAEDLDTSADRLRGNTDADLPETETVDGPRLRYVEDGLEEPLQLEYTVPAVDHRPAFAAFRFVLRDATGRPIATCGVAAPAGQAHVARDEAIRLMELERWNRLDPLEVRAELLEQWHVQAAPPRDTDPVDGEPAQEVSAPDEELSPSADSPSAEQIPRPTEAPAAPAPTPPPASAPSLADQLQAELEEALASLRQAESDAQQALAAAGRAAEEADRARAELEQTRIELGRAEADAETARSEAEAARGEAETARGELGAARAQADELDRTLAKVRACLTDFDSALADDQAAPQRSF